MVSDKSRSPSDTAFSASSSLDLQHRIPDLDYGDHTCILYNTPHQQMSAAIPFLKEGFEEGNHCLYIVHGQSIEDVESQFEKAGVDVQDQKARGALSFQTARDSFLRDGTFSVEKMLEFVDKTITSIREDGFSGFRSTGDMSWVLDTETSPEEMVEYEARLNGIIKDRRAVLLCQYNAEKFPANLVQKILCTHPIAVVEDLVCSNPFYEPPELLLDETDDEQLVEWRISQLQDYQQNQQQHEERESLLKEIHHRVKNNMQVINSFLSMQSRNIESDKVNRAFQESIRRVRAMAMVHEKLYQTSDLSRVDFEQYLRDLVDSIVETSNLTDELAVEVTVEDYPLDLDRGITCGLIANELVTNSLQHSLATTENGTIDIKFGGTDSGGVFLTVKDNGKGFSENFDPKASSSTGLDIVSSLVEYELDGTVKYENDNGARVTVIF